MIIFDFMYEIMQHCVDVFMDIIKYTLEVSHIEFIGLLQLAAILVFCHWRFRSKNMLEECTQRTPNSPDTHTNKKNEDRTTIRPPRNRNQKYKMDASVPECERGGTDGINYWKIVTTQTDSWSSEE
jgi:hypothetical protein